MKRFRGRNGVEEEAFQPQSMKTAKKNNEFFFYKSLRGYKTNLLNAAGVDTTNSPKFKRKARYFS